jgi:hypothetical protein
MIGAIKSQSHANDGVLEARNMFATENISDWVSKRLAGSHKSL